MKTSPRHAAVGLLRLVATAVVGGLVLSLATLPVVGSSGWVAKRTSAWITDMPTDLPEVSPARGSVLVAADGHTVIATLFEHDRRPIPLARMAPDLRDAVVAIEDSRFYSTGGIDTRGTARAAASSLLGRGVQGGSSITQQYVKNVLVDAAQDGATANAATARSLDRKVREARLALAVAQERSKDEILEGYLNLVYFGSGAWGVEAAAQRYFSVPASRLTLPQAALLAGLLQSPNAYDPLAHPAAATARRDVVLARMAELDLISSAEAASASGTPLKLRPSYPRRGCAQSRVPFYCDWVFEQLLDDPRLGANVDDRRRRLLEGGLTVTTGLDLAMQQKAQRAVDSFISRDNRVAAVSVLVEPGTGFVRATAVNRTYGTRRGQTVYPLASARAFQTGSTFKAFTLAAALEAGVRLSDTLPGGDRYTSSQLDNPASGAFSNAADGHGKDLTLSQATAESVNTAFVQLQERVGTSRVADAARRAGMPLPTKGPHAVSRREGSLTLGSREASAMDVASAYATFAAHGVACRPRAVVGIRDDTGALPDAPSTCRRAFTAAVADTVTSVLAGVVRPGGTGTAAAIRGRAVAGKTGTTENEGSAWFAGYTSSLATAVVLSDPRGAARYPLHDLLGVSRVYGGTLPARLWANTMDAVLAGTPAAPLPTADPAYLLRSAPPTVPSVVGLTEGAAADRLRAAGYCVATDTEPVGPDPSTGSAPFPSPARGSVVNTRPPAGAPVPTGAVVVLRIAP